MNYPIHNSKRIVRIWSVLIIWDQRSKGHFIDVRRPRPGRQMSQAATLTLLGVKQVRLHGWRETERSPEQVNRPVFIGG